MESGKEEQRTYVLLYNRKCTVKSMIWKNKLQNTPDEIIPYDLNFEQEHKILIIFASDGKIIGDFYILYFHIIQKACVTIEWRIECMGNRTFP